MFAQQLCLGGCRPDVRPYEAIAPSAIVSPRSSEIVSTFETDQGEVSRIERRRDVFVSTIRRYAEALGARCDVVLPFCDGRRVLIAEPEPEDPPK